VSVDTRRELQQQAYRYPYHYLPEAEAGRFSQHQHWSWGYRYLGRIQLALELLGAAPFQSLLDVGCGDGRFLREVQARFGGKRLLGIDRSERAVRWAQALNPAVHYRVLDITRGAPEERFDAVTLLEVIEHIPPVELREFLKAVSGTLCPGGRLILTTPHSNTPVDPKHYQHFNVSRLRELLQEDFDPLRCVPFDYIDWPTRLFLRLLGGSGRYFIVTHAGLNSLFFQHYLRRRLHGAGETRCHRLACVAQKRPAAPGTAVAAAGLPDR
jgi:2-polyprenyl-3-methyl-5-hydroxy-6-metoxy-1,4-benzoquinol methylase